MSTTPTPAGWHEMSWEQRYNAREAECHELSETIIKLRRAALAGQANHFGDANKMVESAAPVEPAGEWTDWNGSDDSFEGPIPFTPVSLRFRDGSEHHGCNPFDYTWRDRGAQDDIVAYQIATPPAAIPEAPAQTEASASPCLNELVSSMRDAIATPEQQDTNGGEVEEIHLAWRGALKACGVSEADRDAISQVVRDMLDAARLPGDDDTKEAS